MRKNILLMLALLSLPFSGIAQTVYDDFNLKQWTFIKEGVGPKLNEANQRLEITLPGNSKDGPNAIFFAGYKSNCELTGNFDIQVDYSLLKLPAYSGLRVGITIPNVVTVARESFSQHDDGFPAGDYYLVGGATNVWVPTSDKKGKLRLVRTDTSVSGYYFDAASLNWTLISSTPVTTDTVKFQLWAWSHNNRFDKKTVAVAFDNVVVNSGSLVGADCPFVSQ